MKTMKTYEEFWPFSKKPEPTTLEVNQKKITELPLYLKNSKIGSNILGLTITRYDVGYSKMTANKLIVEFTDSTTHQSVRINFITDDNFFIVKPDTCFLMDSGRIIVHSMKHFKYHKSDIKELLDLQSKIMDYFKKQGLVKSDEQS
jgi:hypothetical protein